MSNTVRAVITGVKDIVYALLTSGDSTTVAPAYGPVKPLFNVADFGFDPAFTQSTGYYNDSPLYVFSSHGEMSFTLTGDDVFPENAAELLGQVYQNGILVDNTSDTPVYAALGGKITRSDGTMEYFWLPKVQFSKGAMTTTTKQASISPQNYAMGGRAVGLSYNSLFRTRVRTNDTAVPATVLTNWFNSPVISSSPDLNALTVTAAPGTAGKIVFTFAKTGGGNVNLNESTIINSNIIISIDTTGAIVTPTSWTIGAAGGTTQTATANGLTAVKHDFVVTNGVKDNNAVGATTKAGSVTVA